MTHLRDDQDPLQESLRGAPGVRLGMPLSAALRAPPAAARSGNLRSHRILVIDDDAECAEALREVLELEGHAAVVAHDGPQGLARGREFRPEIVLCDVGLPGQDGYQVAKAMRREAGLRDAFLIAVTGYARADDRQRAMEAGFDAHLSKPSEIDQILGAIALAEGPSGR